MSTVVVNPAGAYPDKGWYLSGDLSIQPQMQTAENLPMEIGKWGSRDRTFSTPVMTLAVTGINFTLAETENWRKLALKTGDQITVVLATGESFGPGELTSFSRKNTPGSNLYDVTLGIELDIPDPDELSYEL